MPFIDSSDLPALKLAEGVTARVIHTGHNSLTTVTFVAGAAVAEHSHPHEQVTTVFEGKLELTVAGETVVLERGQAMILPPHVPHSATALTDCLVMDVFHPVREDLRALAEASGTENGE
jgi:quercetin dioxygenase-like cupin family protein